METEEYQGNVDRKNVFPFFDLSGELRNNVYDNALVEIKGRKYGLIVEARDVPAVNLLLINRKFKDEYQDRTRLRSQVNIIDDYFAGVIDLKNASVSFKLPSFTIHVTKLHLHLHIVNFSFHKRWIDNVLTTMPHLRSLTVVVVVSASIEQAQAHYPNSATTDFCNLQSLHALDVYADKECYRRRGNTELKKEHKALTLNVEKRCLEKFEYKESKDEALHEQKIETGSGLP